MSVRPSDGASPAQWEGASADVLMGVSASDAVPVPDGPAPSRRGPTTDEPRASLGGATPSAHIAIPARRGTTTEASVAGHRHRLPRDSLPHSLPSPEARAFSFDPSISVSTAMLPTPGAPGPAPLAPPAATPAPPAALAATTPAPWTLQLRLHRARRPSETAKPPAADAATAIPPDRRAAAPSSVDPPSEATTDGAPMPAADGAHERPLPPPPPPPRARVGRDALTPAQWGVGDADLLMLRWAGAPGRASTRRRSEGGVLGRPVRAPRADGVLGVVGETDGRPAWPVAAAGGGGAVDAAVRRPSLPQPLPLHHAPPRSMMAAQAAVAMRRPGHRRVVRCYKKAAPPTFRAPSLTWATPAWLSEDDLDADMGDAAAAGGRPPARCGRRRRHGRHRHRHRHATAPWSPDPARPPDPQQPFRSPAGGSGLLVHLMNVSAAWMPTPRRRAASFGTLKHFVDHWLTNLPQGGRGGRAAAGKTAASGHATVTAAATPASATRSTASDAMGRACLCSSSEAGSRRRSAAATAPVALVDQDLSGAKPLPALPASGSTSVNRSESSTIGTPVARGTASTAAAAAAAAVATPGMVDGAAPPTARELQTPRGSRPGSSAWSVAASSIVTTSTGSPFTTCGDLSSSDTARSLLESPPLRTTSRRLAGGTAGGRMGATSVAARRDRLSPVMTPTRRDASLHHRHAVLLTGKTRLATPTRVVALATAAGAIAVASEAPCEAAIGGGADASPRPNLQHGVIAGTPRAAARRADRRSAARGAPAAAGPRASGAMRLLVTTREDATLPLDHAAEAMPVVDRPEHGLERP